MTNLLPYHLIRSELAILLAIRQHKSPADTKTLVLPEFLLRALHNCWNHAPESRPFMRDCVRELIEEASVSLQGYLGRDLSNVPPGLMTNGDKWFALHDGDRLECRMLPSLDVLHVWYATYITHDGEAYLTKMSSLRAYELSADGQRISICDGSLVVKIYDMESALEHW